MMRTADCSVFAGSYQQSVNCLKLPIISKLHTLVASFCNNIAYHIKIQNGSVPIGNVKMEMLRFAE